MKKIIISLLSLAFLNASFGQSIERKLVGVNGSTLVNGGYQLSYAIGEVSLTTAPYANTSSGSDFFVSIGFLQPFVSPTGQTTVINTWVSAYPNPATSFVRIDTHGFVSQDNFIKVSNVLGQQVIVPPAKFVDGSAEINVTNLAKGIYFISATEKSTNKTVTAKIVKQ